MSRIAFILPIFDRFAYARRAALSFLKYTPKEHDPLVIAVDDASPLYAEQNWDAWREGIPQSQLVFQHFEVNAGLTRGWNWGLLQAREFGATYAIAGNSDLLFTPGWQRAIVGALNNGAQLVGPVTNAPGKTNRNRQNVLHFFPGYRVTDDPSYNSIVADHIWRQYACELRQDGINGFCMIAKVADWFSGAYRADYVFDPSKRMTGNEDELQRRWRKLGRRIGFCPGSFVFHYRSVTRGPNHNTPGWYRLTEQTLHQDV